MTALHLLSRLKPASFNMALSNSGVFLALLIVSVGLSDSASVPISSSPTTIPNDDADLELLLSSKILMDRTSSTLGSRAPGLNIVGELANKDGSNDEDDGGRLGKNVVENISSYSGTNSNTVSPSLQNEKFFEKEDRQDRHSGYSSGGKKNEGNSYEMSSSPLHVARCRATCLQKFNNGAKGKKRTDSTSTVVGKTNNSPDEVHLIQLLQRKASSPFVNKVGGGGWNCLKENSDCLECWKSCELFGFQNGGGEMDHASPIEGSTIIPTQGGSNEATRETAYSQDEIRKGKQSVLDCSLLTQSKQCLGGCQVACSFYQLDASPLTKEGGENSKRKEMGWRKDVPVVKIVPGKITWPPSSGSLEAPVVYLVIQEYPDGKWREIAQTTGTSMRIPKGLTSSAMSSKLRAIRVLLVGMEGVQAVYSQKKIGQETMGDKSSLDLEGGSRTTSEAPTSTSTSTTVQSGNNDGEVIRTPESNDSSSPVNTNDQFESDPIPSTMITSSYASDATQPQSDLVTDVVLTPSINQDFHVEGPFSFELRVVSLIHQKSLVIAELKWDEIGGNVDHHPSPSQEYLITWELTEGGLKGHLVTDSTSVTLSLWPDTTYQVQVEEFHQNFDSDGEQPPENSSSSLKSLPIIVDTSRASFPPGSADSLSSHDDDEDDEFHSESTGNEWDEEQSTTPNHESFMKMRDVLTITIISGMFVVLILTAAALAWIRVRMAYSSSSASSSSSISSYDVFSGGSKGAGHISNYFTHSEKEPRLLTSQDDLSVEDSPSKINKKFSMKGRTFTWGKGEYKLGGQAFESGVVPVAVISSSSSISSGGPTGPVPSTTSPFHYYSYKDGRLLPSFSHPASSVGEGLMIYGREHGQGCTSSAFCWLPDAGSGRTEA